MAAQRRVPLGPRLRVRAAPSRHPRLPRTLQASSPAPPVERVVDLVRDMELEQRITSERVLRCPYLVLAERRAMRAGGAGLVGGAVSDHRPHTDQRRMLVVCDCPGKRVAQRGEVVGVIDELDMPAI